jgi:hypothetical protein
MRLYQIGIIALTIRHYRTNERKGTSDYNTISSGLSTSVPDLSAVSSDPASEILQAWKRVRMENWLSSLFRRFMIIVVSVEIFSVPVEIVPRVVAISLTMALSSSKPLSVC